jgi:hypothetical protein
MGGIAAKIQSPDPRPGQAAGPNVMSKKQILDFQARWMRPAGIAAIVGAALLVASGVVGSVGSADNTAEQLDLYQRHSGRFLTASLFSGLGLLLLGFPLSFLFRSALLRADRMRAFPGPLIAIGVTLVAAQGVLFSLGLKDASDQYVAGVGAVEANARKAASQAQRTTTGKGKTTTSPTTAGTTTTATAAGTTTAAQTTAQRVTNAKDDFADDKVNDEGKVQVARFIGLFGGLALIGGAVYTLVWAMRTGLLTRFMATIGIVFIAALLLLPGLGPFGLVLWFAILGLMLAGWWIRPLPPAWAAGEAIPWPRPGEDLGPPPGESPPGTVEGSGREVSDAPLAEEVAPPQQPEETPGQRRRKRKRRN